MLINLIIFHTFRTLYTYIYIKEVELANTMFYLFEILFSYLFNSIVIYPILLSLTSFSFLKGSFHLNYVIIHGEIVFIFHTLLSVLLHCCRISDLCAAHPWIYPLRSPIGQALFFFLYHQFHSSALI